MQPLKRIRTEFRWLAVVLVLVSLHFWFPNVGERAAHDSYSTAAAGKKAFYLLMRASAPHAERANAPLASTISRLGPGDTLCLLAPSRYPTGDEWETILTWVSQGGSLVFAARNDDGDYRIDRIGVELKQSRIGPDYDPSTNLDDPGDLAWMSQHEIGVKDAPEATRYVVSEERLQAVEIGYGSGRVLVVASDFVFTNQSLDYGDNARLAHHLLAWDGFFGPVYFEESLNRSGTPKVVGLLLEPFLRPLTVQLLIGLAVFGWWRSRRFGPLIPESIGARHNIVAHTDAVGDQAFRVNDGASVLRAYLRQMITELKLKSHRGRENRVLEPIARRLNTSVESLRKTFSSATKAARNRETDRKTAGEYIRRLAVIRQAARPATNKREEPESVE